MNSEFWSGLLDWFKDTLCAEGTISPEDLDLITICEEPAEVVDAIFAHYEARGFEPSAKEKEILLEL